MVTANQLLQMSLMERDNPKERLVLHFNPELINETHSIVYDKNDQEQSEKLEFDKTAPTVLSMTLHFNDDAFSFKDIVVPPRNLRLPFKELVRDVKLLSIPALPINRYPFLPQQYLPGGEEYSARARDIILNDIAAFFNKKTGTTRILKTTSESLMWLRRESMGFPEFYGIHSEPPVLIFNGFTSPTSGQLFECYITKLDITILKMQNIPPFSSMRADVNLELTESLG